MDSTLARYCLILPGLRPAFSSNAFRTFSGFARVTLPNGLGPMAGTPGKIRKNPTIAAASQTWPSFVRVERRFNPIALAFETGRGRRTSSPCVRVRGKDTFGKSQALVNYDVNSEKYFANGVERLAKWQRTLSREIVSLHRCIRCM